LISLLYSIVMGAGIMLTLASVGSPRARLLLFYILMFMTMGGIQIEVPFLGSGMRSYLALILLVVSGRTVMTAVTWLRRTRILAPSITLTGYLVLSHLFLNDQPSIKTAFELVGNLIFFILCVAFLLNGTRKQTIWLLVSMGLGLFSNIVSYMPVWVPFMNGWTLFGPIPHYQEPASSGLLFLPLMLMALHSTRVIRLRILIVAGLIFLTIATFVTGARAPSAAFMVILALYRRKLWWTVLLLALGILTFSLLPQNEQTQRMVSRIEQLTTAAQTGTLEQNPDAGMRIENIRIALKGIEAEPFFGAGVGSWYAYRQSQTGMIGYNLAVHSGWVLLIFETGFTGLILYLYFVHRCLSGLKLKFTGNLSDDIGFVSVLGAIAVALVSLGGDALLTRASFTVFSFGAFARCDRLRRLRAEKNG
jgi:O-antigen ligase